MLARIVFVHKTMQTAEEEVFVGAQVSMPEADTNRFGEFIGSTRLSVRVVEVVSRKEVDWGGYRKVVETTVDGVLLVSLI